MIQELFQKWIPTNNIGNAYDNEDISWENGISFTLVA